MDCLGPECAAMILDWLRRTVEGASRKQHRARKSCARACSGSRPQYQDEAPAITSVRELAGAIEHLAIRGLQALQQPVDPRRAVAAGQHD